jgi:hypothetical protein
MSANPELDAFCSRNDQLIIYDQAGALAELEALQTESTSAAIHATIAALAGDADILDLDEPAPVPLVSPPGRQRAARLEIARRAVGRLERELGEAQARRADCDRLCRKHAGEVLVIDAIGLACEIEEDEAALAGQRANLAALVAVLTDAHRAATGTGNSAHMPARVQRVLVDHADRLLATLDRGPWLERFAALVAGEYGEFIYR